MKFISTRTAFAAVVVGLAFTASHATNDAEAATPTKGSTVAFVPALTSAKPHFASLDEAVAAGKLDRQVVNELRRTGSVEAIVTVDESTPSSSPSQSFRTRLDTFRRVFAARKAAALAPAGEDVEVLHTFGNLAATFVRFESEDALLTVVNGTSVARVRANVSVPVATQQSLGLIKQPQAAAAGHIGTGAYVAVLDTGVDYTRAPFGCTAPGVPSGCKVVVSKEQDGDAETYLDEGSLHGTNVAGVVASVAPGAKILAYDVFSLQVDPTDGQTKLLSSPVNQLKAIEDILDRKRAGLNVVAFNMSLGGGHWTSSCNAGLSFGTARSLGILPVVAAGNARYVKDTLKLGIAAPACDSNAISVGAVHDSTHTAVISGGYQICEAGSAADTLTTFTQTASILDMVAPGSCIVAAGITMNGTSQAAPHVAGAVAVLASAKFGSSPLSKTGADQIEAALQNSGPSIYDGLSGVSRKRLDIQAALQTLLGSPSDTTPPAVGSVTQVMPSIVTTAGSSVDSLGRVPVKASWSASDSGSGLAALAVEVATNGVWSQLSTPSATQTSVTVQAAPGTNTYQFRVAAKDAAGNWSAWAYGPTFKLTVVQETSTSIAFAGSWTQLAWTSAFGGYMRASNQAGATARLTFTGRNVAWIATAATNRGQATVSIDGSTWGTRDLYSTSMVAKAVAFSYFWTTPGTHTIEVKVVGTSGRPDVDVDAFVVMS